MEHSFIIIKRVQKNQRAFPKVLSACRKFINPTILFKHFIYQTILPSVEKIPDFFVSVGYCKHDAMLHAPINYISLGDDSEQICNPSLYSSC